jgi:hypothetical protein
MRKNEFGEAKGESIINQKDKDIPNSSSAFYDFLITPNMALNESLSGFRGTKLENSANTYPDTSSYFPPRRRPNFDGGDSGRFFAAQ